MIIWKVYFPIFPLHSRDGFITFIPLLTFRFLLLLLLLLIVNSLCPQEKTIKLKSGENSTQIWIWPLCTDEPKAKMWCDGRLSHAPSGSVVHFVKLNLVFGEALRLGQIFHSASARAKLNFSIFQSDNPPRLRPFRHSVPLLSATWNNSCDTLNVKTQLLRPKILSTSE